MLYLDTQCFFTLIKALKTKILRIDASFNPSMQGRFFHFKIYCFAMISVKNGRMFSSIRFYKNAH